jgi:DNA-binding LacI/PurR family transcriptional regulator/DNA-binding transcriptional regulator YhcF (GntR family)
MKIQYAELISRLEADIRTMRMSALPSLSSLARRYQTTHITIRKALLPLEQAGLITFRRGKRALITDGAQTIDEGSWHALYASLRDRIASGVYRAGTALPKFSQIAATYRVSHTTIGQALERLSDDGYVHKSGKQWMVGRAPARAPLSSGHHARAVGSVVLVMVPNEFMLFSFFKHAFYTPFLSTLQNELMNAGMHMSMVLREGPGARESLLPAGPQDLRSEIRRLGDDYAGALIVDNNPQADNFADQCVVLSDAGSRPVVFFDYTHVGDWLTRSYRGMGNWYFRLDFDESAAARCAVDHLARAGHRRVGMPLFKPEIETWVPRRYNRVKEAVDRHQGAMTLLVSDQRETLWEKRFREHSGTRAGFLRRAAAFADMSNTSRQSLASRLRAVTASMSGLIDQGVTALISSDDALAREHYFWCRCAGVDIPRHLSMVSFDNLAESAIVPVSTVDFGFARLGYLAARILIGDLAVACEDDGTIRGECTMIDRGSIRKVKTQ